ncbi:MAG: ISAs1 family transposase [Caldilineaceae bacterium]
MSELHPGGVVAIDGIVVQRSFENCPQQGPLHLVSAWATENNVVLAQLRVDEKANEIVAVPELLEQLDVTDCVVAADALNCQVKTAALILEKSGDYLLVIKGNQPGLYDDIAFREDDERLRRDNSVENFAIPRGIALSLLKQDTSSKLGVKKQTAQGFLGSRLPRSLAHPVDEVKRDCPGTARIGD